MIQTRMARGAYSGASTKPGSVLPAPHHHPATSARAFSSTFHQDWVSGRLWAQVHFNKHTPRLTGRFPLLRVEAQTQIWVFLSTRIDFVWFLHLYFLIGGIFDAKTLPRRVRKNQRPYIPARNKSLLEPRRRAGGAGRP